MSYIEDLFSLKDKTAVVIGGGGVLAGCMAEGLAKAGANIVILDTDPVLGTITNTDGYFRLENVPIGRYNIKISYIGYDPYIVPEVLVETDSDQ